MKIAYIQSIGGASGDMLLAALLDAGLPLEFLQHELAKLPVSGYALSVAQEARREMRGVKLNVDVKEPTRYSPKRLSEMVSSSGLDNRTKQRAEMVLTALWTAEGRVHGESQAELELEELGTVDTLVDVVGVSIGLDYLEIEKVYASPLVLGAAQPPRRPGGYPNPAPATLELAAMAGAPVAADHPMYQGAGELTTPTGAALITALAAFERPAFSVTGVGVGLGSRDPQDFPNILRVWLGEMDPAPATVRQGAIVLLETNLDDVQGEVLGYAQEQLFSMGALDVWYTPVQMKKNRPATVLSAIGPPELEAKIARTMLAETSTLGVRVTDVRRYEAERRSVEFETSLGMAAAKVKRFDGRETLVPEFEVCLRLSVEHGIPIPDVYLLVAAEGRTWLAQPPDACD